MTHRLEERPTAVTWTERREILIGHDDCAACGAETPSPTQDQLLEIFQEREPARYLWPGCSGGEHWLPPGWAVVHGAPLDLGLLCPTCVGAVCTALRARGWKVK